MTAAGLGLLAGLQQLQRHPPAASYRQPLAALLVELGHGHTLSESLTRLGWLPDFDVALLHAGEQSGRLDACFRLLAEYYFERARMARQLLADLAYPAFLFHFAIFIFPFAQFFISGDWRAYLVQTFGILLPLYGVIALFVYAGQSRHGEGWRSVMERALRCVPVLGVGRRDLALARLAAALEALLSAGVTVLEAWELAAKASGSPALSRTVLAWRPTVDAGSPPSEVVSASGCFPQLFASQYATGELSGRLDETLRGLHRYYQEEGTRKLHNLAQWTPRLVYLFVVFMIAYHVVRFWMGHFAQISNVIGP